MESQTFSREVMMQFIQKLKHAINKTKLKQEDKCGSLEFVDRKKLKLAYEPST